MSRGVGEGIAMLGELYSVTDDRKHHKTLQKLVDECIDFFTKKYGYKPTKLWIREDDVVEDFETSLEVKMLKNVIQPHHIMLLDVVKNKKPVVYRGVRKCIKKLK